MDLKTLISIHNWNLPEVCPVCGESLILSSNHKQLSCSNDLCPSKASGTIAKWVEKMKILELGLTSIEKIQEYGYFMKISDIYKDIEDDHVNDLMSNEFGKNWDNIKDQIYKHTECTLACFISGYNIAGIGEKQIQKVIDSKGFTSVDEFVSGNYTDLICDGIGDILAEKMFTGIVNNLADMKETMKYIKILTPAVVNTDGKLQGKSFCFTGAMEYKRAVLQGYVTENGGVNFDSVKKGLDFLVMADPNSTSTKAVKARTMGVTLISPEEFLTMVGK